MSARLTSRTVSLDVEEPVQPVSEFLVELTVSAVFREVRMVFAEELAGDSGVAFQSTACGLGLVFSHSEVVHRFVGLFAGALASPALSWMVMVPERIIYRQGEFWVQNGREPGRGLPRW